MCEMVNKVPNIAITVEPVLSCHRKNLITIISSRSSHRIVRIKIHNQKEGLLV